MALQALTLRSSEQLAPLLVCISTLLLATSAVVLRVMAHRIKRVKLCLDDHTIFLALVSFEAPQLLCQAYAFGVVLT